MRNSVTLTQLGIMSEHTCSGSGLRNESGCIRASAAVILCGKVLLVGVEQIRRLRKGFKGKGKLVELCWLLSGIGKCKMARW